MKKVFILDNFDSFTMNVCHLFSTLAREVTVKRADRTDITEIIKFNPDLLIISPGPGKPENAKLSLEAIDYFKDKIPVFGICLGMQCMAIWGNGKVEKTAPIHGKQSLVFHNNHNLLKDIPSPFYVARYHSLFVSNPGKGFEVIASTKDGIPMAMAHRKYKLFGVQFHPESFLTEYGLEIGKNALYYCN